MVAIVALHGVAIAVGMTMKLQRDAVAPETVSVLVSIATPVQPERPPELPLQLPDVPQVAIPVPLVQIDLAPPPAPAAITVVAVAPVQPRPVPVAPDAQGDEPIEVLQADYLEPVRPVYPAAAKRARAQGTVMVRTLVDNQGRPRDVRVHQSSGFSALDRAACDAVMKALFKPYRLNGIARSMVVIVPIEFSLRSHAAHNARHEGPPGGPGRADQPYRPGVL